MIACRCAPMCAHPPMRNLGDIQNRLISSQPPRRHRLRLRLRLRRYRRCRRCRRAAAVASTAVRLGCARSAARGAACGWRTALRVARTAWG